MQIRPTDGRRMLWRQRQWSVKFGFLAERWNNISISLCGGLLDWWYRNNFAGNSANGLVETRAAVPLYCENERNLHSRSVLAECRSGLHPMPDKGTALLAATHRRDLVSDSVCAKFALSVWPSGNLQRCKKGREEDGRDRR